VVTWFWRLRGDGATSYDRRVETWFHVSSAANRESIRLHGLDWRRMGTARGIAGSRAPEADGVFLCADESDVRFFLELNNTGGPVDVWEVAGVDGEKMIDNGNGFLYFPGLISPGRVTLVDWSSVDAASASSVARAGGGRQQKKAPRTRHGRRSRRGQ